MVTAKTSSIKASAPFVVEAAPAPQRPDVSTDSLRFGVATPGGALAAAELDEVSALAGESPSMVLIYKDFLQPPPLTELDAVRARGAVPLVTWEPWVWGGGVEQPAYSLDRITAGDFDGRIREWGQSLAAWGQPVMLRFAHEMNGNWYPWAESVNGNQPGDYVQVWQHVHDSSPLPEPPTSNGYGLRTFPTGVPQTWRGFIRAQATWMWWPSTGTTGARPQRGAAGFRPPISLPRVLQRSAPSRRVNQS